MSELNPNSDRLCFRLVQEPTQKLIDIDTAVQMLTIVMPSEPLQPPFCDFLQQQTEYKVVNFDQWTSFLRFTQDVRFLEMLCFSWSRWRQLHPWPAALS